MNAAQQFRCVEIEEAHCTAAVRISGEQRWYVGSELVVSGMPDHLSVNYDRDGGTINRNLVGILSQRPSEVDVRISRCSVALSRRVDGAKWFGSVDIIEGDRFCS